MTTSEAAKNFGKVIRRVLRGETISLTSRGEPVAVLSPVRGPEIDDQFTASTEAKAGVHATANGGASQDGSKRNKQSGKRRTPIRK